MDDNVSVVATIDPKYCSLIPGDIAEMDSSWVDPFCEPQSANSLGRQGPPNFDTISQYRCFDTIPLLESFNGEPKFGLNDPLITQHGSVVRDLGNLSIALYDCAAQLRFGLSENGQTGVQNVEATFKATNSRQKRLFVIDEVFRLTTKFRNIVGSLTDTARNSSVISATDNSTSSITKTILPTSYNEQISDKGTNSTISSAGGPFSHVDEATMLMVMSCHCRLIDIYLSIFHMMQACIEYSLAPQLGDDWAVVLPQLQIGSQAAPPMQVDASSSLSHAKTSMYMLMITMFSSQLCAGVAGVMGIGSPKLCGGEGSTHLRERGERDPHEDPVSTSRFLFEAVVVDRTNRLDQAIKTTKVLLQRFSLMSE